MFIYMFNILGKPHLFIKECGNCKKYFITQKGNISNCDRVIKDNLTCKDIGKKEYQKKKQEEKPIYNKYRSILSKKHMRASRNSDLNSYFRDYEDFKKKSQKYLNDIKEGKLLGRSLRTGWISRHKIKRQKLELFYFCLLFNFFKLYFISPIFYLILTSISLLLAIHSPLFTIKA